MIIRVSGTIHEFAGPLSAQALLARLELPVDRVALAINGEIVRRRAIAELVLQDADDVEVISAVAGG